MTFNIEHIVLHNLKHVTVRVIIHILSIIYIFYKSFTYYIKFIITTSASSPHPWHKQIDVVIVLRVRWHAKSHHHRSVHYKGYIFKVHKNKYGVSSVIKGNRSFHNVSPLFMYRKENYYICCEKGCRIGCSHSFTSFVHIFTLYVHNKSLYKQHGIQQQWIVRIN